MVHEIVNMDLINKYRQGAYRNFHCNYMWFNINKENKLISSYFDENQKGQSQTHRFRISDIENVLSEKVFEDLPEGFILKVVIQKANFNVKNSTVNNGYTTRLLFLTNDTGKNEDWYLYGYAKGLYNNMSMLDIKNKESLGWSLYISLMEKETNLSGRISDYDKIRKLLSRLKANK